MTRKERDRREMSFFDHVEELRTRIIRCVVYVAAASVAGWVWREPLLEFIRRPAEVGARAVGVERLPFRVFEPLGGFMIAIQVALVAGIVLASPLILWEIWAFVEPALEDHERKYAVLIVPSAVVLFLGGVVFCYYVSPRAFAFLFSIDKSLGVDIERTLQPYLWFILRLMLGFGLAFELPLVLMFLAALGLVNARPVGLVASSGRGHFHLCSHRNAHCGPGEYDHPRGPHDGFVHAQHPAGAIRPAPADGGRGRGGRGRGDQ